MSSAPPTKSHAEEEDDLDELDDVLDQFGSGGGAAPAASSSKSDSKPPAAVSDASSKSQPTSVAGASGEQGQGQDEDGLPSDFDDLLSQQFAKELAKGMDDMFGGAAGGASSSSAGAAKEGGAGATGESGDEPPMSEEEMMKQFEKIMAEMGLDGGAGGGPEKASSAGPSSQQAPQAPANFQDAIKSTMSRLRESNANNSSGGGSGGANPFGDFSDEDMAKLLSGLGGDGTDMPEGEEGMANMLEKMMGELMSKDVLHEPLKELRDKYPPYLASPPAGVSEEDLARYKEQYRCVDEVVKIFEMPEYESGSDARKQALKSQVSDLMSKMQDAGAPPQEVVGDMPAELENLPGFGGGSNGQGGEEDCVVM